MRLCVINGSPRAGRGNTAVMTEHFAAGFVSIPDNEVRYLFLARKKAYSGFYDQVQFADVVLLAFPLFFISMPGPVKVFLEALPPGIGAGRQLVFLVQSGFPETEQFAPLVRYLETVPERFGFASGGIIVKGFGSSLESMPAPLNRGDLRKFEALGRNCGQGEILDSRILNEFGQPERLSPTGLALFQVMKKAGLLDSYTRAQFKKNGISPRSSLARPLAPSRER